MTTPLPSATGVLMQVVMTTSFQCRSPRHARILVSLLVGLAGIALLTALAPQAAEASRFCDALQADLRAGGANSGLLVTDLESDQELCAAGAEKPLILASNTKLFTTAALLGKLGPQNRLKTTVWAVGRLNRAGVLRGDLYLRGAGDPALAMPGFAARHRPRIATNLLALTAQVRAAGIRQVTGRLYADDTILDRVRGVADSGYRTSIYIGPLSGLALNSGYTGVGAKYFSSDPARLAADRLQRSLRRAGVSIRRNVALGKLPRVPGGSLLTGLTAADRGAQEGKKPPSGGGGTGTEGPSQPGETEPKGGGVTQPVSGGGQPASTSTVKPRKRVRQRLAVVRSPTVALLSEQINVHSDNFFAETMIKTLGAMASGKGTTTAGARVVMRHARSLGSGAHIVDGSGLTRGNTASPRQVVSLLTSVSATPYGDIFRRTLPLSSRDGTLVGRMKGTAAERRCEAKTGTLTGVSALSGYCDTRSGRTIAFSILMNSTSSGTTARYYQDRIAARIAGL